MFKHGWMGCVKTDGWDIYARMDGMCDHGWMGCVSTDGWDV